MDIAGIVRNLIREWRSSFFCLRRARWSRASSVSRHDLHVAAIPAAQAINTIHQFSAIHEKPAAKEFVIRMCSSLRLDENRITCSTAETKVTEVLYRQGTETRTMRTGNRRQRKQAAGDEMLGPPLSLSVSPNVALSPSTRRTIGNDQNPSRTSRL
jgi:hypothetical protein